MYFCDARMSNIYNAQIPTIVLFYKQKFIGNLKQYVTNFKLEDRKYRGVKMGYDLCLKVTDYSTDHFNGDRGIFIQ